MAQLSNMKISLDVSTCRMDEHSLTVGIVCYHSPLETLDLTLSSLEIAVSNLYLEGHEQKVSVYILDNSSNERYSSDLKCLIDAHKISETCKIEILYERNEGFGAGHNAILGHLSSDFHLILNPDVTFHENALVAAMNTMVRHKPGLILPKIFDDSLNELHLHFWYVGPLYIALRSIAPKWLKGIARNYLARKQIPATGIPIEKEAKAFFSGCCMLFDRAALSKVHGFCADYFMYFEDYDLSLRILKNHRVVIEPAFSIVHFGGNASGKNWRHRLIFIKSAIKFYYKVASGRIFATGVGQ